MDFCWWDRGDLYDDSDADVSRVLEFLCLPTSWFFSDCDLDVGLNKWNELRVENLRKQGSSVNALFPEPKKFTRGGILNGTPSVGCGMCVFCLLCFLTSFGWRLPILREKRSSIHAFMAKLWYRWIYTWSKHIHVSSNHHTPKEIMPCVAGRGLDAA